VIYNNFGSARQQERGIEDIYRKRIEISEKPI
jgi:hypothetical protein